MRIRYPKKAARVARRENFGDFKGVFKANRGGTPLENRRASRAAKFSVFSSEKKGVPPCFQGGRVPPVSVKKVPPGFRQKFGVLIRYPLGFQILKFLVLIRYPLGGSLNSVRSSLSFFFGPKKN